MSALAGRYATTSVFELWNAAVALELGLFVATRDEHFNRVPGLTVFDWR